MPTLLSFLGSEHSWATQTSAGDFMKAIITVSANASQNEQTCIGPNELTRQLVSKQCVEQLIGYMLGGGNALTVGVGIVIEVIRKNNSDYDPDVGAEANAVPSSRDPIYLGTLLRFFADHVPDFMNLIMNAPAQRARLDSTFGDKIEPLGFDRFKTCELMAELLHCSNMGLLNEVGSEELIAARDNERNRLRIEGKLSAMRGEEVPSSADDLTMRISHSSPADEGRRLEITNISEEDGFEEVGHSSEMTEDTSHEFVKAEDEIQVDQPTSFLDKNDGDFVDEPLTSPLPPTGDDKPNEQQFDEPDMVVAPLSPSKQKANEVEDRPSSPSKAPEKVEDLVEDMQKSMLEDKPTTPEAQEPPVPAEASDASGTSVDTTAPIVADSETKSGAEEIKAAEGGALPATESAEPPAEDADKPAPLFSKPAAPEGIATDITEAAETQDVKENDETTKSSGQQSEGRNAENRTASAQPQAEAADIPLPDNQEFQPEAQDLSNVQPVVGDFLKMQFVEYGVVPTILSFFFKYPWNNFLHNVVYDIVQQVFNGPMDRGFNPTLAISLFEAADVTTQIINGQNASEESQRQSKTRMGYMGHLTLIAEEVVKFTERHPPELLSDTVLHKVMDQEWIKYVEGALAETRERDNAILGGVRPEVALSNRQAGGLAAVGLSSLGAAFGSSQGGGSNALADAGLNGNLSDMGEGGAGNGIGPFAISAGTLMSGFGSSSDEDEDEETENEEDVNNEVSSSLDRRTRRYSGLSFAGRPAPHTFIRSVSMEMNMGGSDDDEDDEYSDDEEESSRRSIRRHTVRSVPAPDSVDPGSVDDNKRTHDGSRSVIGLSTSTASEDQLFEEVSLDEDEDSDASMGDSTQMAPDEWEDVEEDMFTEQGRADSVRQAEDGAQQDQHRRTVVVSQAVSDNKVLPSTSKEDQTEGPAAKAQREHQTSRNQTLVFASDSSGNYEEQRLASDHDHARRRQLEELRQAKIRKVVFEEPWNSENIRNPEGLRGAKEQ